jgi:hypothetical protein
MGGLERLHVGDGMTPHAFRPIKGKKQCAICGGWADANYHNLELFTDADRDREAARQLTEAEEMTAQMRTPLKDVSTAAGIMERDSPLFFGTGINPGLC